MNNETRSCHRPVAFAWCLEVVLLLGLLLQSPAYGFNLNVVGSDGTPITNFRWTLEEDDTKHSVPGTIAQPGVNYSLSFHTSYMPVLATGNQATLTALTGADPNKRYFISVLPDAINPDGSSQYTNGGASVAVNQTDVTVVVNTLPLPTAQISVFIFNDNQPLNGQADLPAEQGLPNFTIQLMEAGGTYGQSGGQVTQDAFGKPLGTTYNPDGSVAVLGNGIIKTDANGVAVIKNLVQGKYTIFASPPAGSGWVQTSTIEGTKGDDAWVKPNEPAFFVEFGPPGHHVNQGFVQKTNDTSVLKGGSTITGKIVNLHTSRPPEFAFYDGHPLPNCWIGLNDVAAVGARALYAQPCNADSTFSIPNVPAGLYQLAIWDEALDNIFATYDVNVPAGGGEVALLDVPVFGWFAHLEGSVFFDRNSNGFRDCVTLLCNNTQAGDDVGIPDQNLNIRFRDGSIYQSFPTKADGSYSFPEVFPFFNWMIAEVDFARFKPTGATIVVDNGGAIPPDQGWTMPSRNKLGPQPQNCTQADIDEGICTTLGAPIVNPNTGNNLARTELGMVLLEGVQSFLGQTNVIDWGKQVYPAGQNGGIAGIVHYPTTRAEDDPRYAAAENWEPGIPRVQVNLYIDCNADGIIDKPQADYLTNPAYLTNATLGCASLNTRAANGASTETLADVDNWPFGWRDGSTAKGPEDVDRNGNGIFDRGDAVDISTTDSWDDNVPTGCQGDIFYAQNPATSTPGNPVYDVPTDCYDGLRNFNQIRPAVFDGGYAFGRVAGKPDLPVNTYIVEANAPPGYIHQKEEDRNVFNGDTYTPSPLLLPPVCVNWDDVDGDGQPGHTVPPYLALFPSQQLPAAFAGQPRAVCDRKQVRLAQGTNPAPDFYMFTEAPVAGHVVGMILDDLANEFDPHAPTFGEKYAPPHLPVSFRDYTGREIGRVYADQWGTFNALVPSTYTINPPFPSGVSPQMVTACMNHPGPIDKDPVTGTALAQPIIDPFFDRQYSQFCYTFQYMPGKTTYLDTPVLRIAAFAGLSKFPLDCEQADATPMIYSVSGKVGATDVGPYVPGTISNTGANRRYITIVSVGDVEVPNPAYDTTNAKTIVRHYGFGNTQGTVKIGNTTLSFADCSPACNWTDGMIVARVPQGTTTGELTVTRGDNGTTTTAGVTVTIGGSAPIVVAAGQSIQAAIDAAAPGALITVAPGQYDQLPIMYKRIRLQGWGPGSTVINAAKYPAEKLQQWRIKLDNLLTTGAFDLLPGQTPGPIDPAGNEPALFNTEEGAGITVLAKSTGPTRFTNGGANAHARIDGFTITGADSSGGIFVNGYANFLEISNNRIIANNGFFGGGIRVGNYDLTNGDVYTDNQNNNVAIHNNQVIENGSDGDLGGGGGIALYTGASNYNVARNFVCGNFTSGEGGGGIGHFGLSNNGVIEHNTIVFNESFQQAQTANGGGILIAGLPSLTPNGRSEGSGNVTVDANLIQGNLAGAGDGGGIRTQFVNGADVTVGNRNNPSAWNRVNIFNNMIVNNVSALAGGGISLQDTVRVNIANNTIANNDSTATAGEAFSNPNSSNAQPAGVVARAHSTALAAIWNTATAAVRNRYGLFSNPGAEYTDRRGFANNILWHNRSFSWEINTGTDPSSFGLVPNPADGGYSDVAVLGTATPQFLDPRFSTLSAITEGGHAYHASNQANDPMFLSEYFNGAPGQTIVMPEATTTLTTAPAFDEGGNWIDVHFGPLTPTGNYHIQQDSPAALSGTNTIVNAFARLRSDYDGDTRPLPNDTTADIGADEINQ